MRLEDLENFTSGTLVSAVVERARKGDPQARSVILAAARALKEKPPSKRMVRNG
jgi:hypothetical protein